MRARQTPEHSARHEARAAWVIAALLPRRDRRRQRGVARAHHDDVVVAHGRKHTRRLGPAGGACTCRLRRKLRAGAQGTAQKLAGSTLRTWLPKPACVRGNVDPTAPRTIEWPDVRF